jgi:protein involved in polysaccharide export with SLBB domain
MIPGASVRLTDGLLKASLGVVLAAVLLAGCASTAERGDLVASAAARKSTCPPAAMLAAQEAEQGNYIIRPGDELQLDFYLNPEFNRDVTVRPDGNVSLDLVGSLPAAGLTPEQFAQRLDQAYRRELRNPGAAVHVKNSPTWRVYVQGQVAHAGAFPLQPGETALQAIAEAGGVTENGGADSTVLIRRDACGNPHGMKIDLQAANSGKGVDDVALLPSDVLVVPRSPIANVDLFVKQYIQGLLPFPPYMSVPVPAL